jgi:hypothetical protein
VCERASCTGGVRWTTGAEPPCRHVCCTCCHVAIDPTNIAHAGCPRAHTHAGETRAVCRQSFSQPDEDPHQLTRPTPTPAALNGSERLRTPAQPSKQPATGPAKTTKQAQKEATLPSPASQPSKQHTQASTPAHPAKHPSPSATPAISCTHTDFASIYKRREIKCTAHPTDRTWLASQNKSAQANTLPRALRSSARTCACSAVVAIRRLQPTFMMCPNLGFLRTLVQEAPAELAQSKSRDLTRSINAKSTNELFHQP